MKKVSLNKSAKFVGCIFSITDIKQCNKETTSKTKDEFLKIKQKYNIQFNQDDTFHLKSILKIDIKIQEFKDKEILFFKSLLNQFDFVMIYSYSNTMLQQISSKKCCNMIVNVFSQDVVKRFDFIHHFNSGINHVILQDFKKNYISLGVDISNISKKSEISLSKVFSSCIQNSKLATKSNVPHIVFKIIEDEFDIISETEVLSIHKSFFKAQPFQIKKQMNYFPYFFEMQDKERKNEIVGFQY